MRLAYRPRPTTYRAGVASTALALRPVAYTLGELYLLLGQREEAARQFDHAARVATSWGAPHRAGQAREARAKIGTTSRK